MWTNVSSLARQFICDLLKTNPNERLSSLEALNHPWLKKWGNRSDDSEDRSLNPNVVKALVKFKEFSDIRKLLCEVLSFTLLPYQIKELRRQFEIIDRDSSGEISLAELKMVLMTNAGTGSLGALTETEVEDIFNAMRVRKAEPRIHWHEFIAASLSQCNVDDRNLRLAFDRFDSDHKGYINLDDIMDLMTDNSQNEESVRRIWSETIRSIKRSHARITYDDFLMLMKGQLSESRSQELTLESEQGLAGGMVGSSRHRIVSGDEAKSCEDVDATDGMAIKNFPNNIGGSCKSEPFETASHYPILGKTVYRDSIDSTIASNRKLYRSHRQLRMSVLNASKRFEEHQAKNIRGDAFGALQDDGGDGSRMEPGLILRRGSLPQAYSKPTISAASLIEKPSIGREKTI